MNRMAVTISKAVKLGLCDKKRLLDCYNKSVALKVCYTITTRISASNHYWVMEIDD